MHSGVPPYFTSLRPFLEYFGMGTPWLMYHKLGPRPPRVRLKGLYLSSRLFERQLSELRAAGFRTPSYGSRINDAGNHERQIRLTFDDGSASVFRHGMAPLAAHGFRGIQFLVAGRLGSPNDWEIREGEAAEPLMDDIQVREWLAAGHEIGSHTLTHPFLTRVSLQQANYEITASKKQLEDQFGVPIRHFCYPYGDWNTAVRDLVSAAGYASACTTGFGINTAQTHPFELKRILARYQSISFKAIKERLTRFCRRSQPGTSQPIHS